MLGEEIPLEQLPYGAQEVAVAASQIMGGGSVYFLGPGPGKTAMLRALAVSLYKAGFTPIYIKLEWVKYSWRLANYIDKYLDKHRELVGFEPAKDFDIALVDDGELAVEYPRAYAGLVSELRGRIKAVAARTEDLEAVAAVFGDGLPIYIKSNEARPRAKAPFGLALIGSTIEVEVI